MAVDHSRDCDDEWPIRNDVIYIMNSSRSLRHKRLAIAGLIPKDIYPDYYYSPLLVEKRKKRANDENDDDDDNDIDIDIE